MLIINRHGSVLCGVCRSSDLEHHAEGCTWYESNKGAIRLFLCKKEQYESQHEYLLSDAELMQDFWISRGKNAYAIDSDAYFYKNIYKFESDDGSSRFVVSIVRYFTNRHNGQVGAETSMLSIRVNGGKIISICKDKKTLFGRVEIYKTLSSLFRHTPCINTARSDLAELFNSWLVSKGIEASSCTAIGLLDVYYKSKNRILADLRVNSIAFFENFKAPQRAKIYAVAKKNGTKAAIEQMTGAKTRPLQNVLIHRLGLVQNANKAISLGFTEQDVVTLVGYNDSGHIRNINYVTYAIDAMVEFGYSRKEIMGTSLENLNDIDDCTRMLNRIKSAYPGYVLPKMRISELHDYLVRDFTAMQSAIKSSVKLRQPRVADQSVIDSQYTFWAPKTEMDIFECGTSMIICVGSYENSINKNNVDIYIVSTPEKKYFACLSVIDNKLQQAKLHRNRQVYNNPSDADIIRLWCEANGIDHNQSHDLHGPFGNKPF